MSGIEKSSKPQCALMATAILLALAVTAAGAQEIQDIDLSLRVVDNGEVQVTCYAGVIDVDTYTLQVRQVGSNQQDRFFTTQDLVPGQPVTIQRMNPAREYKFSVLGLDGAGQVVSGSRTEMVQPELLEESTEEVTRTTVPLDLRIRTLDPGNFPFIFTTVEVDSAGIAPRRPLTQENFAAFEDGRLQTESFEVTPPGQGGGSRIADIIFIVDNSGSMSEEQAAVRDNLIEFANALEDSGIDYRLGLVRFGQYANGGYPILVQDGTMTGSAADYISNYLSQLTIDGGTEPGLAAILTACNSYAFRPGSQRHFLLITDEDSDGGSLSDAITCCLSNNITVHVAAECGSGSSNSQYCGTGSIRDATDGLLFSVVGPYDEIFDRIGYGISNRYVIRYRTDNPVADGIERTVTITVDAYGEHAEDSAAYTPGEQPTIQRTPETIALSASQQVENQPLTFAAYVTDPVAPFVSEVYLYYRTTGEISYSALAMSSVGVDLWSVTVAGSEVQPPGFDYYITATDGIVTVSDPSVDPNILPYQIAIRPNVAPVITHTPVTSAREGQDINIEADVFDDTDNIDSVILRYREYGDLVYTEQAMTSLSADLYQATIPGGVVMANGVEYEIRATDNYEVATTEGPYLIEVTTAACLTYGQIEICADTITDTGGSVFHCSGNVRINDIIFFTGDIEVYEPTLDISGSGQIYIPDVPWLGGPQDIVLYDGSFRFTLLGPEGTLTDFVQQSVNDYMRVAGLKIELTTLELIVDRVGVRIAGSIELPEILGNASVDIQSLEVTQADGVVFSGCISFESLKLPGNMGLNYLELCYFADTNCFSGQGSLSTKVVNVEGEAEVCNGMLNSIGIEIGVSPGVAIGPTGLFLTGGGGGVRNLQNPPVYIWLQVDITGGPQIGGVSLVKLDDMTLAIEYPHRIEGSGNLQIFGVPVASGMIYYVIRGPNSSIGVEGNIDIVGILIVDVDANLTDGLFTGGYTGVLRIPDADFFPLDLICTAIGCPYDLSGADGHIDNAQMEGKAYINLWFFKLTVAHRILFTPSIEVYLGTDFDNLVPIWPWSMTVVASASPLVDLESSTMFEIEPETRLTVFRATGASEVPEIALLAPNGERYERDSAAPGNTEGLMYIENGPANKAFFLVSNPLAGIWVVEVDDDVQDVTIDAFSQGFLPAVRTSVEPSGNGWTISSDVSVAGQGTLSLFYDDDGSGRNGVPILEDIPVESGVHIEEWLPEGFPSGTYYVYSMLEAGPAGAVFSYAPTPIAIEDPTAPPAPTGLRGSMDGDAFNLEWNEVPDVEGYEITYGRSGGELVHGISLVTELSHRMAELTPGHIYDVAVRAYGTNERWGLPSEILTVQPIVSDANNSPFISSSPPAFVRMGEVFWYAVEASDPDGDALSFEIDNAPDGMTVSPAGEITWEPTEGQVLFPRPVVRVTDGRGGSDEQEITTELVNETYGHGMLFLDRRVYIGTGITAKPLVFDQDVALPAGGITVEVSCVETGDNVSVLCPETASGSNHYLGEVGFETSETQSSALYVTEGATLEFRYHDVTTGETLQERAIWIMVSPLEGTFNLAPDTFNEGSHGRWVTAYYEPPLPFTAEMVDPNTVRLNGVLEPDLNRIGFEDNDGNGVVEIVLKFDRADFEQTVEPGPSVEVSFDATLYSELATLPIHAGDDITVINPQIQSIGKGTVVCMDGDFQIKWTLDDGSIEMQKLFASLDGREDWGQIAEVGGETRSYLWRVPGLPSDSTFVRIDVYAEGLLRGRQVMGPFSIEFMDPSERAGIPDEIHPKSLVLYQNQPNPFRESTRLRFDLPHDTWVSLAVYDAAGRLVRTLASAAYPAGSHVVRWDGRDETGKNTAAGVYFTVLKTDRETLWKKMLRVN